MGLFGSLFGTDKNKNSTRGKLLTFEEAIKACDRKEYAQAFPTLLNAAEEGNAEAAYRCGLMYMFGWGTGRDQHKAKEWYEKAAEQGHIEAQCECGLRYGNGWGSGIPEDKAKSLYWYEKAAEAGNADAQYSCGTIYADDEGAYWDPDKAEMWLTKSAEAGQVSAMFSLGTLYSTCEKKEDPESSLYWYTMAAEKGDAAAQHTLGYIYYYGNEILEADKCKALSWFEQAAAQNYNASLRMIDQLYQEGVGENRDKKGELDEREKRAMEGSVDDQLYCGKMYHRGGTYNGKSNLVKALYWYNKAAEQGNSEAQFQCARMYELGDGAQKSNNKALEWYQKAVAQNHTKAQYNLALMYLDFSEKKYYRDTFLLTRPPEDAKFQAWKLMEKAAAGLACAQYMLGNKIYFDDKNYNDGYMLVLEAAKQGHEQAIEAVKGGNEMLFQGKDSVIVSKDGHYILLPTVPSRMRLN